VRIANRHRVPLWTHGQGRNNGYGGPAPRVKDSVIVSLREMNRVLEIDPELAYAVVEPGVRWFDLYEAVQAAGYPLMLLIADLGWGSVPMPWRCATCCAGWWRGPAWTTSPGCCR
jgi:4-cresol dehydrogenase (hydroxylating)